MRALVEICSISQSRMVADAVVQMARHSLNFLIVVDEANGGDVQGVITERHYVTYGSKVRARAPGLSLCRPARGVRSARASRARAQGGRGAALMRALRPSGATAGAVDGLLRARVSHRVRAPAAGV